VRYRKTGFTLIELLAASALAALLMLVLFQVIGSLGRTRMALSRSEARHPGAIQTPWKSDLLDSFRWDLGNATERKLQWNRITLQGHGSLDRSTLAAGHDPVTVMYLLERRAGRSCLVRWQARRTGLENVDDWSELVCADVSAFSVEPVQRRRDPNSNDDASAETFVLRVDGSAGHLLDEVIVLK
jgi:prepilin-type N-terminal cleavage/methylation domain-containing protein